MPSIHRTLALGFALHLAGCAEPDGGTVETTTDSSPRAEASTSADAAEGETGGGLDGIDAAPVATDASRDGGDCPPDHKAVLKYAHPARTCTNGTDTCTTPVTPPTSAPLDGNPGNTASYGCSFGYWSGGDYCNGNPVNGRCPSTGAFSLPPQGSFDVALPRNAGTNEAALLCHPANEAYTACE